MMAIDVLISESQIKEKVKELAMAIENDYQGKELVVVCVLNGAFVFCSDLVRQVKNSIYVDFMKASSYGDSTVSSGNLKVDLDLKVDIENKHVLLIEDIVDTGLTLTNILKRLSKRKPASIKLASLLYKEARNKYPVNIDYLGFSIDDLFVIGYGLDYAGKFRELPYIGVYSDEDL
jgi:hypoxanthine phosphoribosyltransferase